MSFPQAQLRSRLRARHSLLYLTVIPLSHPARTSTRFRIIGIRLVITSTLAESLNFPSPLPFFFPAMAYIYGRALTKGVYRIKSTLRDGCLESSTMDSSTISVIKVRPVDFNNDRQKVRQSFSTLPCDSSW